MKKVTSILLAICLIITIMTACNKSGTPGMQQTQTPAATTDADSGKGEFTGDVWNDEGWEPSPWADVQGEGAFGEVPKLTEEYKWRTTDPSVEREKNGNFYPKGFPIVEDKVTLTFFARQSPRIVDIATHYVTKKMEEKTNVHIEWVLAPEAEIVTKRNLLLASGEYPDVFFGAEFSQTDELMYGVQQKILIPLNPYIEKYGYYTAKAFASDPDYKSWITAPDGNIYTLGSRYNNYHVQYQMKGWINQGWLDKLNLKMPTTTDEYYNVLCAFRDNGVKLPVTGSPSGWNTKVDNFLMMPFIYNDSTHILVENGSIKTSVDQDKYRQGLQWINKLYNEKLLDRDAFVRNVDQLASLGNNSDGDIMGSTFAGGYVIFVAAGERDKNWTALPPLKGPNGETNVFYTPFQYGNGNFAITNTCKNPEVAFRWADFTNSPEFTNAVSFGRYGEEWTYAEKGELNTMGTGQAVIKRLARETDQNASNIFFEAALPPFFVDSEKTMLNLAQSEGDEYTGRMFKYTADLYDKGYNQEELFPPLYIDTDKLDEYTAIQADFTTYVDESFAKFVTGEWNINDDATWNKYLSELKNLGTYRMLEIAQDAYDTYLSNKK